MRRNGASKITCRRSIVVSRNERATFQYFETASSAAKKSDLNTILLTPLNCSGIKKATDWFYINYHKFHMCRSRNSLFVVKKNISELGRAKSIQAKIWSKKMKP